MVFTKDTRNIRRALFKMALVLMVTALGVAGFSRFLDDQAVSDLKHDLSLWNVVILVVIINMVSFACFIVIFAAFQWVCGDLKKGNADGLDA